MQTTSHSFTSAKIVFAAVAAVTLAVACGDVAEPRLTPSGIITPLDDESEVANGACDVGAAQACKVQLDASNCFVGEQQCDDSGTWGACLEADGLNTTALGSQTDCASNPCNPWCQHYGENPTPDIQAVGSAPPPGGNVAGLPSAWQHFGLDDNVYGNSACTEAKHCQFDHRCNVATGACVPWGPGQFDPNANGIDLTAPVVCNANEVTVCNRGSVQAPAGIQIAVMDAAPSDFQKCSGFNGSLHSTCNTVAPLAPGQCTTVLGCSWSGTKTIYVNPPLPPGTQVPVVESSSQAGNACANNWSVYHSSAQCSCSAATVSQTLAPVNMFYVLDNSASMFLANIWVPARDATIAFLQDPGSDFMNVTLRTFGDKPTAGCNSSSCSETACSTPAAPLKPLSDAAHQQKLIDYVNAATAEYGTPHIAALGGAAKWATDYSIAHPGGQEVVVYVSDGGSLGSCVYTGNKKTRDRVAAKAADALAAQGVLTYAVALPGADTYLLNAIAQAGGTTLFNLTNSTNVGADLTSALQSIQTSLLSCDVTIPNAGQVDPTAIDVEYLAGGMPPAATLVQVSGASACSGAADEYYLDDPSAPTKVVMCPVTCDAVRADPHAQVDIVGGCVGGYQPYSPPPFAYHADCSSYPMSGPVWEYFSFDSEVPGNASIAFEVRTGMTPGEIATAPWTSLTTATQAQPAIYPSAPLSLTQKLGQVASQHPYLELRVTLNPTSAGTATPTLYDWNFQFSCLDNE